MASSSDGGCHVEVGSMFTTFQQFQDVLRKRKDCLGEKWVRKCRYCKVKGKNLRTVAKMNARITNPALHYKEDFQYSFIDMVCVHGGTFKSKSPSNKTLSKKLDCPAKIKLVAKRDKDVLLVTACHLEHNHQLFLPSGNLTSDQLVRLSSSSAGQLLEMVKTIIPELHHGMHKGQAGRVAIIGGCKEYTGAPYFAAISALKVGADLSHVFCTADAAGVIKSYSPELIVHPILDSEQGVNELSEWLPRFHALVIGPGLGREESLMKSTAAVILRAKERHLPLVIDADGLFLITQDPSIVYGYDKVILTPNVAEFARLYKRIFSKDPDPQESVSNVKQLSREMGNVTIVQKGAHDVISNGEHVLVCTEPCSPRRCGGQGDLLSGSMGTFSVWAYLAQEAELKKSLVSTYGQGMCAAYAACVLTRRCNSIAFKDHGRSMTTTDMIGQIHCAFEGLFSS